MDLSSVSSSFEKLSSARYALFISFKYASPSDGLSGMTDEEKIGVKYKDIAKYIYGEDLDEDVKQKIKKLHDNSRHKFFIPTYKK